MFEVAEVPKRIICTTKEVFKLDPNDAHSKGGQRIWSCVWWYSWIDSASVISGILYNVPARRNSLVVRQLVDDISDGHLIAPAHLVAPVPIHPACTPPLEVLDVPGMGLESCVDEIRRPIESIVHSR